MERRGPGGPQPLLPGSGRGLCLSALLAAAWILPAAAFPHGVEIFEATGQVALRTAQFMYSTGEPMLFAKVKVFSPSMPASPAQESVADRNGYFSFVPFENGDWRLTAEDGMGHKGEIIIVVEGEGETAAALPEAPSARLPGLAAGVLGLSLILNIFALWYFAGLYKKGALRAH
jgi:nickel transport protein